MGVSLMKLVLAGSLLCTAVFLAVSVAFLDFLLLELRELDASFADIDDEQGLLTDSDYHSRNITQRNGKSNSRPGNDKVTTARPSHTVPLEDVFSLQKEFYPSYNTGSSTQAAAHAYFQQALDRIRYLKEYYETRRAMFDGVSLANSRMEQHNKGNNAGGSLNMLEIVMEGPTNWKEQWQSFFTFWKKAKRQWNGSSTTNNMDTATPPSTSSASPFTASSSSEDDDMSRQEEALNYLEQAARLGHSEAQHIVASSLASGILPIGTTASSSTNELTAAAAATAAAANQNHVVPTDFGTKVDKNLQRALLLWHMAAMNGNVEASMALGFRHLHSASGGNVGSIENLFSEAEAPEIKRTELKSMPPKKPRSPSSHYGILGTCESALLYYEAAANAVMDELEASPFRAKVHPALDRHRLDEVYLHGGAASALEPYNQAHERSDALQYYHIRATDQKEPDVSAAYTLAQLYHYGIRNVEQNLRKALFYYEIAANEGHWESAGQAGKFYFWGIGMSEEERDMTKAYRYFRKGTPGGHAGCLRRWNEQKKKKYQQRGKDSDDSDGWDSDEAGDRKDGGAFGGTSISQCDHPSLNGMGLLHLFGVPLIVTADPDAAEKYFTLARDMQNWDAAYHLGMMRLGWQTDEFVPQDNSRERVEDISPQPMKDEDEELDFESSVREMVMNKVLEEAENLGQTPNKVFFLDVDVGGNMNKKKKRTPTTSASPYHGPSRQDYRVAMSELNNAATKGHHLQARHRLGMMYSQGVVLENYRNDGFDVEAVARSCPKAVKHFKLVAQSSMAFSQRSRAAYNYYVVGDLETSLRHYIALAEAGSETAQANAAFLMERGICLGMTRQQCSRASVRLWRAAARQGNAEASLRVGDFYYHGRMLPDTPSALTMPRPQSRAKGHCDYGPCLWMQYVLYPEDLIPLSVQYVRRLIRRVITGTEPGSKTQEEKESIVDSGVCTEDGTCSVDDEDFVEISRDELMEQDLATAAHYYRLAAEKHRSPRADFNLGFMHEWGLGLKQDFPLAKRHYDLAMEFSKEGALAVQLALFAMNVHEKVVKLQLAFEEQMQQWQLNDNNNNGANAGKSSRDSSSSKEEENAVQNMIQKRILRTSKLNVIMSHILSWESLAILILTIILSRLVQHRRNNARS